MDSGERAFFLEAFHGKTLVFALGHSSPHKYLPGLGRILGELAACGARLIVMVAKRDLAGACCVESLREVAKTLSLAEFYRCFNERFSLLFVEVPSADDTAFWREMTQIAERFRFSRLVVGDDRGGLRDDAGRLVDYMSLQRLQRRCARKGGDDRLQYLSEMLEAGVGAISLCRLREVEQELFTYEGHGTFLARQHYCSVRRMGFDDFPAATSLIRQGEQAGFLLPRSEAAIAELLLEGYGALIGGTHLAGVCSLLTAPYRSARAGEIVALFTLTRFQGEGIGRRMVHSLLREARQRQMRYLFACTTRESASAFFQRLGFRLVAPAQLPEGKWHGYDAARKERLACLRYDLTGG
ncbi:MAG: GNAT family N-acetyltransferase [Magnetococcales bacterium]|nr:GNAT family N-acetyltransferase [Magnetococcales bacterium]